MRQNKILAIVLLAAVPLFGWAAIAQAQSFRTGDNTSVAVGETVDSSLYISGKSVDIAGTVNGDVFCAGQNVSISGSVTGDVFCAGQTVRISGTVEGSVRVAGQTITSSASIVRNLSAAGQSITLDAESRVQGDASLAGQDVVIDGTVGRDLLAGTGTTTIRSQIGRNIQGSIERLVLADGAVVGGDVRYTSPNELSRQGDAQVTGRVQRTEPSQPSESGNSGLAWFLLWMFVSMTLLALVLVLLIPGVFQAAASRAIQRPGRTLLIGIATSLLIPIAIIVLMFTLVGIPAAIMALLVWLVLAMVSGPAAAYVLGRVMLQKQTPNVIWYMLTGTAVLLVAYMVPLLNILVVIIAYWFGVGIIVSHAARRYPRPRYLLGGAGKALSATDSKA